MAQTPSDSTNPRGQTLGRIFGERFQTQRRLSQAVWGETWLGTDLTDQRDVVIKTISSSRVDHAARLRMDYEADVLRQLPSGQIPALLHTGEDGRVLYWVTEYVDGISLRQRLEDGRLSIADTLLLGRQLMAALTVTHDRGVLHRNIKPSNIVVAYRTDAQGSDLPVGGLTRAVLIGFGQVAGEEFEGLEGKRLLESARYVSPERAGLLQHGMGEVSDLYSAGIVLFECLAGRPPFDVDDVGKLLRLHLTGALPSLQTPDRKIPRALEDVVRQMLRKDPRDRYQTAASVEQDLEFIRQSLERGETEPRLTVGLGDRRTTLTEPAWVGRSDALDTLDRQLTRARRGRGGLVVVEADSGMGKTRLLDECAKRGLQVGATVLRGQGRDQVGQRPFQLLEGVADDIIAGTQMGSPIADEVRQRLGPWRDAVSSALPQLADAMRGQSTGELGPRAFGVRRNVQALAELLDALGTRDRPAIVLLDDCQWRDDSTIELLSYWRERLQAANRKPVHVLLVVAFRSEEVLEDDPLRRLRSTAHIELKPLPSDDLRELITSMAGSLPGDAVDLVEKYAEGSPFMASGVLRGLVESGALVPTKTGWRMTPQQGDEVQSSRQAAALLARRIQLLPDPLLQLLQVAAVLGREFKVEMAADLVGLPAVGVTTLLGEARRRHVVWESAQGGWAFVHDRVRQSLLAELPAPRRQQWHRQAAEYLLSHAMGETVELANHFDAAGDSDRALPHALKAADAARSQHALESATNSFLIAQRGTKTADHATRFRIAEGLGDVLMLQGRYPESAEQFMLARRLADGPLARAKIEGEIGELAFKRGDMQEACEAIEQGLRELREVVPRRSFMYAPLLVWEALVQTLHSILHRVFPRRRQPRDLERRRLSIRLYGRLAYAYWFVRGWLPSLWAHLREMNSAERYDLPAELAQAYSAHAVAISLSPRFLKRGEYYAERSLEIRRAAKNAWGQGQTLHFHGDLLYAASQFNGCREKCRQALELLERTGDFWEVNIARFHIAASLYRLGNLTEAIDEAKSIHESGLQLGDEQASGISLDIWAKASQGKVPESVLRRELERPRTDVQGNAQLLQAKGVKLFYEQRWSDASATFEEARDLVDSAGISNVWTAPILPWLAGALRHEALDCGDLTPHRFEDLLARAEQAATQGCRIARNFQNDLPHALRELGLLSAMRGKADRAVRLLRESLELAERQGARYEAAQTRAAQGRLGRELGWPDAEALVTRAEEELRGLTVVSESQSAVAPSTLSLVDRFDSLLVAGREVARGLTPEAVFREVTIAAGKLLRGEDCRVVTIDAEAGADDVPQQLAAQSFSDAMIRQALESRKAVSFLEGLQDESSEGMELAGVRSALCAPIFVRVKPVALLLVTHRQIVGLFGEDERRLADFITAIAGAALENAQGFAELQELARTLEQRVEERTAEVEDRAEALARSNQELEHFAYVASHDLQEPLRTIASYCQLVVRRYGDRLDDDGREFLDYAIDGARRMRRLIEDLLAFSRLATHGKPFEPADCEALLDRVLFNLQVAIDEKQATVTHDPLPVVWGDRSQISQVLQNLIGNAIKFRGEQPPQVHVGVRRAGEYWEFSVRDNGIGMDPEFREHIFKIFQRLHTREEYDGTGIGLSICKKTIERHGGRIWVESEVGRGSVFYWTLPVAEKPVAEEPVAEESVAEEPVAGREDSDADAL